MAISDSVSAPSSIKKVNEGMRLCLLHFNSWTASHVRRNGNMVARQLAKHAKLVDDCTVWVEDTPFVSKQVLMDVIVEVGRVWLELPSPIILLNQIQAEIGRASCRERV